MKISTKQLLNEFKQYDSNKLTVICAEAEKTAKELVEQVKQLKKITVEEVLAPVVKTIQFAEVDCLIDDRFVMHVSNDKFRRVEIMFGNNEKTGKFDVMIGSIASCGDVSLSDKNDPVFKYYMIISQLFNGKVSEFITPLKNFFDKYTQLKSEYYYAIERKTIAKEVIEYKAKVKTDDEIWHSITSINKYVVVEPTINSFLTYNGRPVHFVTSPDLKKNLKIEKYTAQKIVKIAELGMAIH